MMDLPPILANDLRVADENYRRGWNDALLRIESELTSAESLEALASFGLHGDAALHHFDIALAAVLADGNEGQR